MQRVLFLSAVALALHLGAPARSMAGPITFDFEFDNGGLFGRTDGVVTPPFVGSGTVTIANDPGNGTFTLASLGSVTMSFTFSGTTFTLADNTSDPTLTELVIGPDGSQRRLYFTDPGGINGANGAQGGSLDLDVNGNFLTFEPAQFGGHNLFQESDPNGAAQGAYLGLTPAATTTTPEPASLTLLGLGVISLAGYARRRRASA